MTRLPRLLMVEDEPLLINATQRALRGKMEVIGADNGDSAMSKLRNERFDAILAEVSIYDGNGTAFVHRLESDFHELIPRLLIATGGHEPELVRYFHNRYNLPIVHKPIKPEVLIRMVESVHSGKNTK